MTAVRAFRRPLPKCEPAAGCAPRETPMILTCPTCATRYYAEDDAVGAHGRRVKCAACGAHWSIEAPEAIAGEDAPAPPQAGPAWGGAARAALTRADVERRRAEFSGPAGHEIAQRRRLERDRKGRARAIALAWGGAGVATLALLGAAYVFRAPVVELWPAAASAYAQIGAKVNAYGLDFVNVKAERTSAGATPVLVISGEVVNVTRKVRPAPIVRAGLRDSTGREVYAWSIGLAAAELGPGERAKFGTRLESPPSNALDLEVYFERRPSAPFVETEAAPPPPASHPAPPAPELSAERQESDGGPPSAAAAADKPAIPADKPAPALHPRATP